jgi:sugar (pentulose or hexulose) kinase
MRQQPVIAVIDVGRTNKKLFLFDQDYNIVFEKTARLTETVDEDGYPCENLESLRLSVYDSLRCVFNKKEFDVKAVNFCAYGASMVHINGIGDPVFPLYNYLKPYSAQLQKKFYNTYGGEAKFSMTTASPVLGNLNSGMQLYRLKYERPDQFRQICYSLHLPQYLSYLITGKACSDITSIGCHTNLWDFSKHGYHDWVTLEGVESLLPPIVSYKEVMPATFPGSKYVVGPGLHDSSAALIPYLVNFTEPFVLISTGTWCISLNPFNSDPLTVQELEMDCLCYLQYKGDAVKASRLFAGQDHEDGVKRIADHFNQSPLFYRNIRFSPDMVTEPLLKESGNDEDDFALNDLSLFRTFTEAYYRLMVYIVRKQVISTNLILKGDDVKRIFVDGGFSSNPIYMNLLAGAYPQMEVFAASMPQATALGTALAIHQSWNKKALPSDCIKLQYYGSMVQNSI